MGWGWGPDLGTGVQELTGADAVPTVTLAAAAGDLSQILISRAAETPEWASALEGAPLPDLVWEGPPIGEWHSPKVRPCCADLLRPCGDTFGMHVAATMVDETAVSLWKERHWGEGFPGSPSIHLSVQVLIPCLV